jgi:uncharacterized protein with von Willebrand factor type A (vWA) domain
VRELELGTDMASLNNLLSFLEKVFNGGSDFNEPIKRCLDRMAEAKWANSDILLVSDGELRQPGQEVRRKPCDRSCTASCQVSQDVAGILQRVRSKYMP